MTWATLAPVAAGILIAILPPILKWLFSRSISEATVISSQATALESAWRRNKDLITENQDKDRLIEQQRRDIHRLQAHIGRLEIELDDYQRGRRR